MNEQTVIVIPAYNEEKTIGEVIRGLQQHGFTRIIVVDDGSIDHTGELARQKNVVCLRHILNRGLGGALGTGIAAALCFQPEIIVTFDADGQHAPEDIPRLIEPIKTREAEVVIGSRMLNPEGMPWFRQVANWIANLTTYCLFGIRTTDSQSGLRAFSRQAAARIRIMTNGMEVSSELIAEIGRHRLSYKEVPVRAIYTDYSLSKGQSFAVGLLTLLKLILAKARRATL